MLLRIASQSFYAGLRLRHRCRYTCPSPYLLHRLFVSRLRIVVQPRRKSDADSDHERDWHSLSAPGAVAGADSNRLPSIASGTVAADADAPSCGVDWSALQKAPLKPAQTPATPSPPLSAMTPVSAGPGGCHHDPDQWRAPPNTAELSPGGGEATQSILEIQDTRLDADPVSLYCGY
jgi:hypothetical protein